MDPEWEISEAKLKIYLQKQLRINCYKIGAAWEDRTSVENVLNAIYITSVVKICKLGESNQWAYVLIDHIEAFSLRV